MHIYIYLNRSAPSCKQVFTENKNVKRSLLFLVQQRRSVWFWKQETPICLESAQHATKLFIWVRNWWANTLWSALVTSRLWQPWIEGLFLSTVAVWYFFGYFLHKVHKVHWKLGTKFAFLIDGWFSCCFLVSSVLSSDCALGVLCPCIIEKIKEMYSICRPRVILTGEKKESLGNWYHPLCLKCRKCGRQLAVGSHAEVSFLIFALLIRINV